ncbi:MAG: glycosyltransferase [Planctomycetaceae bacterium]
MCWRLSPQKAPLDVVEAFDELRRLDPTGHVHRKLVFVGDGPLLPAVEKLIRKRRLEDHVHLLGWRSDVASVMKAATVLVLASKWEGLPNVILESQAAGLPVVASAVDGCLEVIDEGRTGRLFPPGDTQRLAHILQELLVSKTSIDAQRVTLARLATKRVRLLPVFRGKMRRTIRRTAAKTPIRRICPDTAAQSVDEATLIRQNALLSFSVLSTEILRLALKRGQEPIAKWLQRVLRTIGS